DVCAADLRNYFCTQDRDTVGRPATGDGLRQWYDLLAQTSGLAGSWCLGEPSPCHPAKFTRYEKDRLEQSLYGRLCHPGKKGGEHTGPSPVDRGRPGSKHHLITDRNGIPLVVGLTAANVNDCKMFEYILDHLPCMRNLHGRPTGHTQKLHADKGYDFPFCRQACTVRHIKHRIARRGVDSSSHLGKHRWVVERTFAWFHRYRRLLVRYERRADIHLAFLSLAAALIAFRFCLVFLGEGASYGRDCKTKLTGGTIWIGEKDFRVLRGEIRIKGNDESVGNRTIANNIDSPEVKLNSDVTMHYAGGAEKFAEVCDGGLAGVGLTEEHIAA